MALQHSLETSSGINISSAYIVILKIDFNFIINEARIIIGVYYNQTSYNNGKSEVFTMNHICSGSDFTTYFAESVLDDADNTPLTQAQEWLLTLPEYSGATEV